MSGSRAVLLGALNVLGAVPVASAAAAVAGGPRVVPGGAPAGPSADSEYRFAHVWWGAAGPLLWWSLRRPEERAEVTRLVLQIAAVGGIARLVSWRQSGRPHPVFVGTVALELVVVPVVLVWHRAVFGGRKQPRP